MRERLLQWLICPSCRDELTLQIYLKEIDEIVEGRLQCRCSEIYPIIDSIPRMLCGSFKQELKQLYADFFQKYSDLLPAHLHSGDQEKSNKKKQTMDRFGYEWNNFSDYNCDNFERFTAPLPAEFFDGKLCLDVGCGAGRHAELACERGAEIIAIDLSSSVDAAKCNNEGNERIHIVQADIYNLPFRSGIFNIIYSLGVIQHLPEPEKGYQALLPFLTKGGSLFIWVYAFAFRKVALELLRCIAQRLSNENIRRMAYLCNLVDYGVFINLYRILNKFVSPSKWIERCAPLRVKEYANHGFRIGYTDWFDRLSAPITNYYKEIEMQNWLKRSGLNNTRLHLEGDSWWWLYGERMSQI